MRGKNAPAMATMEDGRPTELTPYRWWAEGEQGGSQMTAVENAGAGGWVFICEPAGLRAALQDQSPLLPGLGDRRRRRAGREQQGRKRGERAS